jgi:hypothetical protein
VRGGNKTNKKTKKTSLSNKPLEKYKNNFAVPPVKYSWTKALLENH